MIDYELRFYPSHSEAISMGQNSADLRTGENAQIRKKDTNDPNAIHPIGAAYLPRSNGSRVRNQDIASLLGKPATAGVGCNASAKCKGK